MNQFHVIKQETADKFAFYGVRVGDVGELVCIDRGLLVLKNPNWTTYVLQRMEAKLD